MSAADVADSISHWPYLSTLIRLALAVGCGVFVGLEREHHGKAGARTFGLGALLGCLGGLSGEAFVILSLVCLGVMVCFLNWRQLKLHQTLGLTTSAALLIVGFAGVLCGQGHTFTPVAFAVITAAVPTCNFRVFSCQVVKKRSAPAQNLNGTPRRRAWIRGAVVSGRFVELA